MPRVLVLSPAAGVGSGPGSAGKRRQSASVASSSDEEDFSSSGPLSPTTSTGPLSPNSSGPLSPNSSGPLSPDSCSSDYENVTSPNSSTASGPIYVRKPGFTNHAYSVISRPKIKKKRTLHDQNPSPSLVITTSGVTVPTLNLDSIPRIETSFLAQKARAKRDPVPMRLRALPQSFWQQPNKPLQTMSSGPLFAPLPPLCTKDEMADIRPVTPPLETSDVVDRNGNVVLRHRRGERKITVGNTDLLFKLFENVEKKLGRKQVPAIKSHGSIRRTRPTKVVPISNASILSDEDPHMVDAMSEQLFPQLTLEHGRQYQSEHSSLHVVTLHAGDRSITLPSLTVEQNYSQMLSELVMHI